MLKFKNNCFMIYFSGFLIKNAEVSYNYGFRSLGLFSASKDVLVAFLEIR